jgi:hypothetical protein
LFPEKILSLKSFEKQKLLKSIHQQLRIVKDEITELDELTIPVEPDKSLGCCVNCGDEIAFGGWNIYRIPPGV